MLSILAVCVLFCSQVSLSTGLTYNVDVRTGNALGAGTDANVYIKVVGSNGITNEHELDSGGDNFEAGDLDRFSFDDVDVGNPFQIKMYRKKHIVGGDWQLAWVRITYKNKAYTFKYDAWLPKLTWVDIQVSCQKGYYLAADKQCTDIDECKTKCGPNGHCTNLPGTYSCTCKTGFRLVGDQCQDFNECSANHGCDQNGECYNTIGSYKCICKPGYKLQGFTSCVNINECENNPCKENTDCVDSIGSFSCKCKTGFERKDKLSCKDTDECLSLNHCDFKVSNCINTVGSYKCKCHTGFTRSSMFGCKDVDECTDGSHKCVSDTSKCFNTFGNYYCKCNAGYHQGQDNKICIKDKCGPMSIPYQGVVSPSTCTTSDANYFGDVCTVSCNNGYELEDAKVNTVTCGVGGRWEGVPRCQRVKCPALSPLTNGRLLPSTCTTIGNTYQGQCTYLCNNGFQRVGSPLRECQADRSWTGSPPTCIKMIAKPSVQCPSDIIVDLAAGQKVADVSAKWKDPTYTGDILTVSPSYANAKYQYPAGMTRITWTAKNSAGTESCSILVIVNDKEAPKKTSCPASRVAIKTVTKSAQVTWTKPEFTDNVGVTKVTSTHNSGDTFSIGSWNVYYSAQDAAGNRAVCQFEVLVERKGCPDLSGPREGSKTCNQFADTKYCTVSCPSGRQIYNNPSPYNFWRCMDAKWTPTPKVPDCVVATENKDGSACTGNQVKMSIKTSFADTLYCADCPTGTYSSNGKCVPCNAGEYQDKQGSSSCIRCPAGSSSDHGASDFSQCRAVCRPGHYSKDGMDPGCQLCPIDTYQELQMATVCKACPQGTKTLRPGATALSDCGVKPEITKMDPKTNTIDEKTTASISCYATGVPAPKITLKFRKVFPPEFLGKETREDIKDSAGKVIGVKLTIAGATPENTGHYECTAANTFGQVTDVASLTVNKVFGSGGGISMDEDEFEMS